MPAAADIVEHQSPQNEWQLDPKEYESAVEAALRAGLQELAASLPALDLVILNNLRIHHLPMSETGVVRRAGLTLSPDAKRDVPVAAAIVEWMNQQPGPALTILTGVLANLASGPEGRDPGQRSRINSLARIVRAAIEKPNADLRSLIAGALTVSDLMRLVDEQVGQDSGIHKTFNQLWSSWLRHRIERWTMADPTRLRLAMGPPVALPIDLDSPDLPLWGDGAQADDQVELAINEIVGPAFSGAGTRATHLLASSHGLLRRSGETPLALHPDQLVPEALIQQVARRSLEVGIASISSGARERAEPYLALGLQIASGLREVELGRLDWGVFDDSTDVVLLVDRPMLSLRVRRPPNAVEPPPGLVPHLKPTADRFDWPLPLSLHDALKKLAGSAGPEAGAPVLPFARYGVRYRLRESVAELLPGAQFGASRFRLVIAAHLADRHGPEVAQLALRDSFSTSLGPAYYTAVPESVLAQTLSSLLTAWFGEPAPLVPKGDSYIGSRVVLKDHCAREWPKLLRQEAYSAARRKDRQRDALVASRNHLAASLCAATGLRPGRSIGELHLDSVVPELGLVILEDKLVDVLRRTRVAATGWRWTAELRGYLDKLIDLSRDPDPGTSSWARAVLMSEQPLFSLPNTSDGVDPLSMRELLQTMPNPLDAVPNYYRHRLCQRLIEEGVDWELRHAQLGWVVTPSYALADLSPLSAELLGERLGSTIDKILMEDGWFADRQRIPTWSWHGVPNRPLKDWMVELRRYEAEHDRHVRGVREEFKARRREVEAQVLPRLAAAIEKFLPALRLDVETRSISLAPARPSGERVALSMEHYLLVREGTRQGDREPGWALEALAAEYLIHEVVSKAIKGGLVSGPEPPRRHLGTTAQLSPFLPGMGLAIRHAEAIRGRLEELIAANGVRDKAAATQLSVIARSPFRTLEAAAAAVHSSTNPVRSASNQMWLRVPARQDRREVPMVLGGIDAALLARRKVDAPTAKALTSQQISEWFHGRFSDVAPLGEADEGIERVVATLQMAGRLELSGPERLVMEGHTLACVGTTRSVAIDDRWPLRTRQHLADGGVIAVREPSSRKLGTQSRTGAGSYAKFTSALNAEVSRARGGGKSDGKHGWRRRLRSELDRLAKQEETGPNLRLLVEYSIHRLRHGGQRVSNLSQGTLHKEVTRFGRLLLDVLGSRSLLSLDGSEIQSAYLAVLLGKPQATRPDVLEELGKFHRHLVSLHHVAEVDFEPLRTVCGPRVRWPAPGAYSDVELERTLGELRDDLERERARLDAGPQDVRACALRVVATILLEASGARPSSIHGLVLGDIHLTGPGADFLHIHRSGEYGEAKTAASVGFVRLEGDLWASNREQVREWLDRERALAGDSWWRYPVFAESVGSGRRFARAFMTDRIGQLLKWVTDDERARVYWLRKRRITARMRSALSEGHVPRSVYRALRESGHVDVRTTLGSYIHDASVPVTTYLRTAGQLDRGAIIRATGLPGNTLDQAWHRNRHRGEAGRMKEVLDRLGSGIAARPIECITEPPMLYRQKVLRPAHLDAYARARQRDREPLAAMAHTGISDLQADILDRAALDLLRRIGSAPWHIDGVQQSRAVMPPARRLQETDKLFALMDTTATAWLDVLVDAWVEQGYVHRICGEGVVLMLRTPEELRAAHDLVASTGVRLRVGTASGLQVLEASESSTDQRSAHTNAFRWVLAMYWLYRALSAERP
ncbi:hypothetical protein E5843_02860 [Luteimonas yindakuii]|uniref:hypothetical protein n=1 Tax=Luteimonas yindakuii TaxID=2565782 RepID=UPI0011076339|nr:hypothetical protein [Luteimonas yindakuii]QCO66980.2 hypothetical protein E5843_02860 [Luteimonas yindakuii]